MALLRRTLVGFGLIAAGLAVGWLLIPSFAAEEDAAAVREPPPPKPITAGVEVGILREVLVLDGEVQPQIEIAVDPWVPVGASRAVITYLPTPDVVIRSGDPIVALSGRPLIFFSGLPNLYRDLHRGLTGVDIENLQSALVELGYLEGPESVDGVFGAGTEAAVAALYGDIGFAPAPPPAETTAISIWEAENAVDIAKKALSDARATADATTVTTSERALAVAQAQLRALLRAPTLSIPAEEVLGAPHEALIVEHSPYQQGVIADAATPVIYLRTSDTFVVAEATFAQASQLDMGHPAVVLVGDSNVASVVAQVVNADSDSVTDTFVFIDADTGAVPPGTPVVVEVELEATVDEVVSVPLSAVRTAADGTSFVTVVNQSGEHKVKVELGVTIGGRTEILSGLGGDELVVVG